MHLQTLPIDVRDLPLEAKLKTKRQERLGSITKFKETSEAQFQSKVILCLPFVSSGDYTERLLQKFCHSRLGHPVTRHVSAELSTVTSCANSTLKKFLSFSYVIELEVFAEQNYNQFPPW